MLAEAGRKPGGRINLESAMPGLSEWSRVRDWRLTQIDKYTNVSIFPESKMTAQQVLEVVNEETVTHLLIATGSSWALDGIGRHSNSGFERTLTTVVIGVDKVLQGFCPQGKVLIYDDDHYYHGPILALHLRKLGCEVTMVTPQGRISQWSAYTNEQNENMVALISEGVEIITNHIVKKVDGTQVTLDCVFSGNSIHIETDMMLPVTRRVPDIKLYQDLLSLPEVYTQVHFPTMERVGDCEAPGLIAAAVYSGYRAAIRLGLEKQTTLSHERREMPSLE